jgi:hypothetical protein
MMAKQVLGIVLALTLVCSIGAAGEKSQKKAAKDAKGCCAEMTKASGADAKACEGKDMKASATGCPAGGKATKVKDGASAGCCEKGSKVKAAADQSPSAPVASPNDKK